MDTQTQIDRLIELAIIQRSELKQLVEQLPQLREHLNSEVEKVFDETEPQLRAELEEWTTKQTADKTAALGVALETKIADLAKSLEVSTQARYNAIIAEREENARLAAQAEAKIAEHAASLPGAVKEIVSAELARFPRAGEIEQLRKEFAEPRGLNPRGKWQVGESYNKLDFVTINGDSYASNIDNNRTRPSRSSADWTLVAARGTGGGGGPTSLSELTTVPSDGDVLIGSGTSWVTSNLTAGAGISITVGAGEITISATDGDITLDDGTAASPSLHFTNDPDTGIYRPAANTLGISVSGTQVAYFDEDGLTIPNAGVVAGGSIHAANGNANNPSHSFTSDQDTGFYRHATNQIGVSTSGTAGLIFTENAGELLGHTGVSVTFGAGSSGATIALGQGTNGAVTITPKGSGGTTLATGLLVNSTTDSSSKDTGAIVTEGGLGVEKSATFGGNLTVSGTATVNGSTIRAAASTNGAARGLEFYNNGNSLLFGSIKADYTSGDIVYDAGASVYGEEHIFTHGTTAGSVRFTAGSITTTGNLTVSGTGESTFSGTIVPAANITKNFGKTTSAWLAVYAKYLQQNDASGYLTSNTDGSIALNSQSNQNITLTPHGTGIVSIATNLTVSGGTVTSGSGTLTLNSSANTVVLQSAGTTALTLDTSQNATFAALVKTKLAFEAYDGATADRWQLYTYTDKTFRWNYNGSGSDELSMDTSGNLIVAGSMRTGTPTGGTASAWKFGKYNTTAPSATGYVEVDIGGTLYKLLAST